VIEIAAISGTEFVTVDEHRMKEQAAEDLDVQRRVFKIAVGSDLEMEGATQHSKTPGHRTERASSRGARELMESLIRKSTRRDGEQVTAAAGLLT
jgi:hypothetical protein